MFSEGTLSPHMLSTVASSVHEPGDVAVHDLAHEAEVLTTWEMAWIDIGGEG
jgi:hypothetical protein